MNQVCIAALAAFLGVTFAAADDKPGGFRFDKESLGKVPVDWKSGKTGAGDGSVWTVVADDTAPSKSGYALAQTAEGPGPLFNLCVADNTSFADVEVKVAFKAVKGAKDQGGGVVWRYLDANNYYVARYNPLENNYRLYKVVAGKRTQLETKEDLKAPPGEWHTLAVKMAGDKIECFLDGKKQFEAKDNTFPNAGKVGLWTKADAQTHFDDFQAQTAKRIDGRAFIRPAGNWIKETP